MEVLQVMLKPLVACLVLPGILVGIWGYVIATPIGVLVVEFEGLVQALPHLAGQSLLQCLHDAYALAEAAEGEGMAIVAVGFAGQRRDGCLGHANGERQPYITHADHGDERIPRIEFLDQRGGHIPAVAATP